MKLVIDIPEEEYNALYTFYHGYKYPHTLGLDGRIYCAVANGVILPKGHGRLMDMNEIYKALHDEIEREKDCADEEYLEGIRNAYAIVDTSHAIIEADEEAEE
jgi:hypothetical protein